MQNDASDYCLVLLTDPLYLPGTRVAIASWLQRNGPCPIVILSKRVEVFDDPYLKLNTSHFERISPQRFDAIKPYKKRHSRRHEETFQKFLAFEDFGYARNIFLDSDTLSLGPAPLLTHGSFPSLAAALDTGFRKTRGYKGHPCEINSGVLAIDSSLQGREVVQELIELAIAEPGRGGYNAGDQGIINKWIHRSGIRLDLLPAEYNTIKKDYHDTSGLETCRILHFTDRKPWFAREPTPKPPLPLEALWWQTAETLQK
ncbi:glycosyltransferase [Pelagicoccus sp. SDUM812003]|uniref:glycosyltransferase n=1 Tax=Pelagicoccus sp. SDUM812003 TaxID=3041267 RepID=UPI00280CD588|nr:glycosyltransferase [Pelagicoccus sp. SDUM812003]MDQ8205698.1 glycosyltransferase [Pelagicoccus sp. SDUM812003]